jgi:hypothetical protein
MTSSTALYYRAMRRVDRRANPLRAALRGELGALIALSREYELLRQAVRLANRLAP